MSDETPPLIQQNGQSGDQSYGSVAGRDIHNQGASPDRVLAFLERYVFEADQRRETAIKEVRNEIELSRDDLHVVTDALRGIREQVYTAARDREAEREAERLERIRRQAELDAALAAIQLEQERTRQQQEALKAEQRRTRRVLLWFGAALVVALAVAGLLAWDRYTALALARYWFGAGSALAYALFRGRP